MKMNILFINSIQMWGGGEVWLMDIMHGLQSHGHSVFLLCRPNTELAQNAKTNGFDVITMRIGGDFDPFVIWKTRTVMKEKKIDVICTNMDKELRFGGIAAKLAGVKGIVPSREIDYPLKNTLRYRFAYNILATKIAVNSIATQNTVLQSAPWFKKEKIKIIYKGISLEPYDVLPASNIRSEFNLSPDTRLVTFVGQLDERKGLYDLLEAWKSIHSQYKEVVLALAGKGPMQNYIEQFIKDNSLQSSVCMLGFRTDIPSILLQSSMLVLPSLWEGFGYVLVEAMAARMPTVATRTSSIPEIVEHEKSGLLVPPRNAMQLAEAISSLLSDPEKAKKMGNYGRTLVEQKFTIGTMIDEFEKLFQSTLQK